ncbi:hypothetical protein M3Y95_01055100 [Aphelenchoides besseyi]|nr:hypothetical protein M3Y95_01055100 [Aphelenchoides besseyi]
MSVVGFDLGNQNAYIAVARAGGIDVLINDYSLHATPTCVSFGPRSRLMGVAARSGVSTNIKNTVLYFKHLIGRKFDDPIAQRFLQHVPCKSLKGPNGEILFEINYLNEVHRLSVEQITAAFLVKLKLITEAQLGSRVTDVVISVPLFFTDVQRQALLAAGQVAGLNVLNIVNEDVAVGIAYGIYKKGSLPKVGEPPKLVAFVDAGHSAITASLMEFHERQVRVREAVYDMEVGGFHFDQVIRDVFHQEFQKKFGVDAKTNPRAWLRLLDESEKLKKQMSANTTQIPLAIECFMNDVDVNGRMGRAEFEEKSEPLFQRIRNLLSQLIQRSGVDVKDIAEVEIIGGSSRIPFIKQIVAHFFNREPKTTLNADDVIARGAAMQCAILSPSTKVMEFNVLNTQNYSICVNYINSENKHVTQTVFKRSDDFPFARTLSLHKTEPFTISAFYENPNEIPQLQPQIGTWQVTNVTKPVDADFRVVRVRLSLDQNGVFKVCRALYDEVQQGVEEDEVSQEDEKMDTTETNKDANADPNVKQDQQPNEDGKEADEDAEVGGKKKKTLPKKPKKIVVELPIQKLEGYNIQLDAFIQFEKHMQQVDMNERLTSDAKNAVEEYVYSMRDKLCEQLAEFVTEQESEQFRELLTKTEDWLYGDGEDASREEYEKKLAELREVIEPPISKRQREKADKEEIERNLAAEQERQKNGQKAAGDENGTQPVVEEPMDS